MPEHAPRVMLVSLGCAKNTVDSETALGELAEAGCELALDPAEADLILINTCGFIQDAREEAYSVIREMLSHKDARGWPKVGAMGCLAQRWGARMRQDFPELDGVFGLAAYGDLPKFINSLLRGKKVVDGLSKNRRIAEGARLLSTPASYAYLRIADGCENRCSYCAIPLIRGRVRSREREAIVAEAKLLDEQGVGELVLIAQDTTLYGKDLYGQPEFTGLLRELLQETEQARIRVLYAHPAHVSEELLRMLGGEQRLCGYLDLPLQHINSGILKKMNRHYERGRVDEILGWKDKHAPKLVLRTSLITGFPGETEKEHQELLDFVAAGHFQYLGVFAYSREDDTPAADYKPQIGAETAQARRDALMAAQQPVTFRWLDGRIGQTVEVIVDEVDENGTAKARSGAEAPETDGVIYLETADTENAKNIYPGARVRACLSERIGYDIRARLAGGKQTADKAK